MKTLTVLQPESFAYSDTEKPSSLLPNEVLVKVHKIGICGTDYHAFWGRQPFFQYPRILGHELGVEVIAIGSEVKEVTIGQKCAVEPYLNCGKCWACERDLGNCCENLQVLGVHTDGGMREYIKVPAHKLHVSDKLNYEQLALVETLGIGAHAVERANVQSNDLVLVVGAGPIGLSVLEFVKLRGAKVAVVDRNTQRLDFCLEHKKADASIVANDQTVEQILEVFGGKMPTVVLDATGSPASMHQSFNYMAAGGRLVFVGLYQGDYQFNDPSFHKRELTIMGSRNSKPNNFKEIIAAMETGELSVDSWISHRITFEEVAEQLPKLYTEPSLVKAIISWE